MPAVQRDGTNRFAIAQQGDNSDGCTAESAGRLRQRGIRQTSRPWMIRRSRIARPTASDRSGGREKFRRNAAMVSRSMP